MKTFISRRNCFWNMQEYFSCLKGVIATEVGYANGDKREPDIFQLKKHIATHAETVKIVYDEKIIPLEKILEYFLRIVNPYSADRQGGDTGHQYRSGVYFADKTDEQKIKNYCAKIPNRGKFAVEILQLNNF